jgi:tRNA(adenine34) deaminase
MRDMSVNPNVNQMIRKDRADNQTSSFRQPSSLLYDAKMTIPLNPFMRRALELADAAALQGEVPVGAVIVQKGQIIAEAMNGMRGGHDPTAHAEIKAIRAAALVLETDRLHGCDLWVTLEPCAMCAGAMVHARISRLYFAASDPKGGGVEHGARVFSQDTCHHRPEVFGGIGEAMAASQLRNFFAARRSL